MNRLLTVLSLAAVLALGACTTVRTGVRDLDAGSASDTGPGSDTDGGPDMEDAATTACTSATDCPSGYECISDVCVPGACTDASECPAAMACVGGACTAVACATPSECPVEHACVGGFCGASGGPTEGPDGRRTAPYEGSDGGRIVGVVTDLAGVPIEGVSVSLGATGPSGLTAASGAYELLDVTPGTYALHFTATGWLPAYRSVSIGAWETLNVLERLMPRAAPTRIDGSSDNTVGTSAGSATFSANTLRDGSGAPVTGMADVSVTPIDPAGEEIAGGPGDYTGTDDTGMEVPLDSLGMVDIEVVDEMGDPVELASGESIEVVMPVPDDETLVVGDTIPTWIFDPEVPGWVEDGVATVELRGGQLVLVGRVNDTNISYNIDRPEVPVCFTGRVVDCAGYPIRGAEIELRGGGVSSLTTERTATDGTYTVAGTARVAAIVRASVRGGSTIYVVDSEAIPIGGGGGCTSVPELVFQDVRYTSGFVDLTLDEMHTWTAGGDVMARNTLGSAFLFDLADHDAVPLIGCDVPPTDLIRAVDVAGPGGGPTSIAPLVDVGNPIVVDGATNLDIVRNYTRGLGELSLTNYTSSPGRTFTSSSGARHTVDIPGAAGVLPHSRFESGLEMPDDLVVTSPSTDTARAVDASAGLSLRWGASETSTELSLTVIPLDGSLTMLVGTLVDDGVFDLDAAFLTRFRGTTVRVVLNRTYARFEPLATGPALRLRGMSSVSFDLDVR